MKTQEEGKKSMEIEMGLRGGREGRKGREGREKGARMCDHNLKFSRTFDEQ